MAISIQVVFDCADPRRLAQFWAEALEYQLDPPPEGFSSWDDWATHNNIPPEHWNDANAVRDPAGTGPRIFFQRVPEAKVVKNRVHIDVNVGGGREAAPDERRRLIDAAVERLIGAGASKLRPMEERGQYWVVMQDPEGNEFCLQ